VAVLTVLQQPAIVSEPQDLAVAQGAPASFSVGATGGDLAYQWRFNDNPLPGQTSSMLGIPAAQQSNAGGYSVVVTNLIGSVTSRVAVLTIGSGAPSITSQPVDQTILVGSNATFSVSATGGPLTYQWLFNGDNLSNATNNTLLINMAHSSDEGRYAVIVSNPSTSVTSQNAFLTVLFQPMLSNPQMLLSGEFQMLLNAHTNRTYDIEFSTDCVAWSFLTNVTYATSPMTVLDSAVTNNPNRTYRVHLHY